MEFLNKHGLDEHSHPMDWFNALMPLTPTNNIEDAAAANVKGDRRTKFDMSNWAAYLNTKALLANAEELNSPASRRQRGWRRNCDRGDV